MIAFYLIGVLMAIVICLIGVSREEVSYDKRSLLFYLLLCYTSWFAVAMFAFTWNDIMFPNLTRMIEKWRNKKW